MLICMIALGTSITPAASTAFAHPISVTRGVVTVSADNISVSLQVTGEDLLHQDATLHRLDRLTLHEMRDAFDRYAARLSGVLVLRDISGRRLERRVVEWQLTPAQPGVVEYRDLRAIRATYQMAYAVAGLPKLITFRQEDPEPPARMPAQFALLVRQLPLGGERSIRLTAGGNAETLEFDWSATDSCVAPGSNVLTDPADETRGNRFDSIQAILRIEKHALKLDIRVPVPLMETWFAIPRREPDFLQPDEQRAALLRLTEFFSTLHRVRLNARPVGAQLRRVGFVGPATSDSGTGTTPQPLGIFTARVAVSLEYAISEEVRDLDITWGLFNSAVLTADVTVIDGESGRSHRFSTYAPTLSHQRR